MQNKIIEIKFKNFSIKNLKTQKKPKILEMPKDLIPLQFEILTKSKFKLEISKFRNLTTKIFDIYPLLSQKINNLYNNKELYKQTLLITWKIVTNFDDFIFYKEKQKICGIPNFLPFKYHKKGALNKKVDEENFFCEEKITNFYFTEEKVMNNFIRILFKIENFCEKIFENSKNFNLVKNENCCSIKNISSSVKNNISKKLNIYKIYHLCFLIRNFFCLTKNEFCESVLDGKVIKLSEFNNRPIQKNYLMDWEFTINKF